jgi:hypothetical protein
MLNVIMLNVVMLNVIMLNVIMLSVIMLNVIMLSVVMLSVMALEKTIVWGALSNQVLFLSCQLKIVCVVFLSPNRLVKSRSKGQFYKTFYQGNLPPFHGDNII